MSKASIEFEPIRARNISDEIATRIRIEILRGRYAPGDRLPSERELSMAFGVNRVTVREALVKLQGLGLISIRQGSGVCVLDYRTTGKIDLLLHLINTPDSEGRYDGRAMASLVEVAKTLYNQAIELSFVRMKEPEHAELCAMIERQLTLADDIDEFVANNLALQDALFQNAHSIALRLLFNTVREVMVAYSSPFRKIFLAELQSGGEKSRIIEWYRRALACVRSRDVAAMHHLIDLAYAPDNRRLVVEFIHTHTF